MSNHDGVRPLEWDNDVISQDHVGIGEECSGVDHLERVLQNCKLASGCLLTDRNWLECRLHCLCYDIPCEHDCWQPHIAMVPVKS